MAKADRVLSTKIFHETILALVESSTRQGRLLSRVDSPTTVTSNDDYHCRMWANRTMRRWIVHASATSILVANACAGLPTSGTSAIGQLHNELQRVACSTLTIPHIVSSLSYPLTTGNAVLDVTRAKTRRFCDVHWINQVGLPLG